MPVCRPSIQSALILTVAGLASIAMADDAVDYRRDVAPLIQKYCSDCHDGQDAEGGLSLAGYTSTDSLRAKTKVWQGVINMLRGGLMPPEDSPQPSVAERRKLTASVEALLFHVDCRLEQDPGRVTIRRLNRNEYNNTVQDLLNVDLSPADAFPADDVGNGFDNIGDVLSLPPLLMEKYLDAAEQLAAAAIVAPESRQPPVTRLEADKLSMDGSARKSGGAVQIVSSGGAIGFFQIDRPGTYTLRINAGGDQAGPDPARAEIRLNGEKVKVIDVRADRETPVTYELPLQLRNGRARISAHFINDYYQPDERNPKLRGDRNLVLNWMEMAAPQEITADDLTDSHRALVVAQPSKALSTRDAAIRCLRPIVQRAFRRRVSDAEVTPFVRLVEAATGKGESFERGLQVALTGILVSPHFLFRVERDPDPHDAKQAHDLDQYELANRLSYFLWSSMPDERLFVLASRGLLNSEEVLRRETRRMLEDPRADQLGENFAGQWLNLRNLNEATPDPKQFRKFDAKLKQDMKRETLLFFNTVMRENRSVLDFVQGDFTFVNERLARHYGLTRITGEAFQKVPLPDDRKVGVLGHASILTLTSNPTRTSPVKRGKWIMDNLLGTPPPDPPADVPELEEAQKSSPNATLREQLELHRNTPSCAVCHRQMDALGFGLQNFDAIGRWRDLEGSKRVDAAGELPGGVKFSGPTELGKVLAGKREQICRSLAEKLMTYALGRGLQYYDRCAVDQIVAQLQTNDYRFIELVEGIVLSDPFRKRRGEEQP